jgi:hypothetical protein
MRKLLLSYEYCCCRHLSPPCCCCQRCLREDTTLAIPWTNNKKKQLLQHQKEESRKRKMNRPMSSSATVNNKNHPSSSSSSSSTCADDLERKLQGIESSLRQDRESARRQKQLAAERLRLLQQEFDAMDKTVQGLQNKLHSIRDESTNILVPELQSIRTNVDQLTKEVRLRVVLQYCFFCFMPAVDTAMTNPLMTLFIF